MSPKFFERTKYKASNIRKMIIQDEKEWENLVPEFVVDYIKKIDGINRMKVISNTDTRPQEF